METKPPLGGSLIRDRPTSANANIVVGSARPIPAMPAIRSWPSDRATRPAAKNMAAFANACDRICRIWNLIEIRSDRQTTVFPSRLARGSDRCFPVGCAPFPMPIREDSDG